MDLETLAPSAVRQPLIVLALANPLAVPSAFRSVAISVTPTAAALTAGLSLPLELSVTSPSSSRTGNQTYVHVFRRIVPTLVSFVPKEGGAFLIRVRELQHNRWWGALLVQVAGDPLYVPA